MNRLTKLILFFLTSGAVAAHAQLFENLQAFADRLDVGDPEVFAEDRNEGPKGIVNADFNKGRKTRSGSE